MKETAELATDLEVDIESVDVRTKHVVPEWQTLGLAVSYWRTGQMSFVIGMARARCFDEHVVSSIFTSEKQQCLVECSWEVSIVKHRYRNFICTRNFDTLTKPLYGNDLLLLTIASSVNSDKQSKQNVFELTLQTAWTQVINHRFQKQHGHMLCLHYNGTWTLWACLPVSVAIGQFLEHQLNNNLIASSLFSPFYIKSFPISDTRLFVQLSSMRHDSKFNFISIQMFLCFLIQFSTVVGILCPPFPLPPSAILPPSCLSTYLFPACGRRTGRCPEWRSCRGRGSSQTGHLSAGCRSTSLAQSYSPTRS